MSATEGQLYFVIGQLCHECIPSGLSVGWRTGGFLRLAIPKAMTCQMPRQFAQLGHLTLHAGTISLTPGSVTIIFLVLI